MPVKVKKDVMWSMSFAPVMACDKLEFEEKILLNYIMSLKSSFDNLHVTKDKIMAMTGLSSERYYSALSGLLDKKLVSIESGEWRLRCIDINKVLGVEVYDIDKLNKMYGKKGQGSYKESQYMVKPTGEGLFKYGRARVVGGKTDEEYYQYFREKNNKEIAS